MLTRIGKLSGTKQNFVPFNQDPDVGHTDPPLPYLSGFRGGSLLEGNTPISINRGVINTVDGQNPAPLGSLSK